MLRVTWKERLTAPFMAGISFYGRYFLLWSFHIRYKVMNSTCYIFPPLFLFHWCSQVVTHFTFTSETYVILLLLKCLPSNATKKSLVKIVEHKLEETFSDVIWDVHLGRFILFSVPISQQLPRLASLYFLSFLNRSLKFDCTFPWQHSGVLNNFSLLKAGNYSLASNKLQCTLYTIFTQVICTLIFVASIDCPSSPTLVGKNIYYTIFSSRFG